MKELMNKIVSNSNNYHPLIVAVATDLLEYQQEDDANSNYNKKPTRDAISDVIKIEIDGGYRDCHCWLYTNKDCLDFYNKYEKQITDYCKGFRLSDMFGNSYIFEDIKTLKIDLVKFATRAACTEIA
jgi:hypothetical protein